jgi:hypothetical protein
VSCQRCRVKALPREDLPSCGDTNRCDRNKDEQVQTNHEEIESDPIVTASFLVRGSAFGSSRRGGPLGNNWSEGDMYKIGIDLTFGDPLMAKVVTSDLIRKYAAVSSIDLTLPLLGTSSPRTIHIVVD